MRPIVHHLGAIIAVIIFSIPSGRAKESSEIIGIARQHSGWIDAMPESSNRTSRVFVTILELETSKVVCPLPSNIQALLRPGKWADPDPLVENFPLGLLVRANGRIWSLAGSKDGIVYFGEVSLFGGGIYTWSKAQGSFRDRELVQSLTKAFHVDPKVTAEGEQPGAAQPATQSADKRPVKDQPSTPTSKDARR